MKKIKIELTLKEEDGLIISSQFSGVELTLEGYFYLNKIVGASILLPEKIFFDGEERSNPYIISQDGDIIETVATAIAVSKNEKTLTTSATVRCNVETMFKNDLVNAIATSQEAGYFAKKGTIQEDDQHLIRHLGKDIDIVVNLNNIEVFKAIEKYSTNKTYGERLAISLAQRNALKKLPEFNQPINFKGKYGARTAFITLPFYFDKEEDIKNIILTAKEMNANIITSNLINIDNEVVIDESEFLLKTQIPVAESDNSEKYKAERRFLAKVYEDLDKNVINIAKSTLFPEINWKLLTNTQIKLLIQYTKYLMGN